MHSIIAISLAFLVATISAAPTTVNPTLQFTNDQTGLNADVVVPLNAGFQSVAGLLQNTELDVDGTFLATSFELVANFQNVECDLVISSNTAITVDTDTTFAEIDPKPVDLVDAQISCFSSNFA